MGEEKDVLLVRDPMRSRVCRRRRIPEPRCCYLTCGNGGGSIDRAILKIEEPQKQKQIEKGQLNIRKKPPTGKPQLESNLHMTTN